MVKKMFDDILTLIDMISSIGSNEIMYCIIGIRDMGTLSLSTRVAITMNNKHVRLIL